MLPLVCDAEIEFPSGVGSRGTFQSQELSLQPRSRSMINTRKRSGCLIKEQIIYLSRKSVQHNPAMRHCWPRTARKIQGKTNSSSTLVNRKDALILQNVDPDIGVGFGKALSVPWTVDETLSTYRYMHFSGENHIFHEIGKGICKSTEG